MQQILTVDAHAAGEPCRVIHAGLPPLPGASMSERRRAFRRQWDWVRTGLMHEPRGHSGMFGAVLTAPARPGSAYGLIFFDPVGYMDGCGHGTLCSVAVWRRLHGVMPVPSGIDNPDDSVTRVLAVEGNEEHCEIELAMPLVTLLADPFPLPGTDGPPTALVHCGNRFVIAEARAAGIADLATAPAYAAQAAAARVRGLAQNVVSGDGAGGLEVLLYQERRGAPRTVVTFVLFNGTQVDRSPCGTGSAALTALLLARGALRAGEVVRTVGPAGGHFAVEGRAHAGAGLTFDVRLRGTAHITGVHLWVFSEADAMAQGYTLV